MESTFRSEHKRKFSGNRHLRAFSAGQPSQSGDHPVALRGANDVLRGFDSETRWLAVVLVSCMGFGALILAVQEWNQNAVERPVEEELSRDYSLLNSNPGGLSHDSMGAESLKVQSASSELASREKINAVRRAVVISSPDNSSPQMILPKVCLDSRSRTPKLAEGSATAPLFKSLEFEEKAK
jgi:hypothetical protein